MEGRKRMRDEKGKKGRKGRRKGKGGRDNSNTHTHTHTWTASGLPALAVRRQAPRPPVPPLAQA